MGHDYSCPITYYDWNSHQSPTGFVRMVGFTIAIGKEKEKPLEEIRKCGLRHYWNFNNRVCWI